MKLKKTYQLYASFGLVLFVMLGYLIKFFPASLKGIDQQIQSMVRHDMSDGLTSFYKFITNFGGTVYVPILLGALLVLLLLKKWYAEAIFMAANVAIVPILVSILKHVYGRTRPALPHLVVENGLSFPSGHASTSLMFYACLAVLICQRLHSRQIKWLVRVLATMFIVLIGMSRIYLGVHYPTDILGGWLMSASILLLTYPIYDEVRFKWRFKGVQK
ncbi:phosphatase PAP2 family protein [Bacilli bacterium]|nr:phosphatase PAP2 family protein [Bacilli bacterium]